MWRSFFYLDVMPGSHYNGIIMQRKLIKVGTSAAVLIPKAVMDEQGMKIGDMIDVDISKKGRGSATSVIDPNVLAWTEKLRKRYQPMLKKLVSS